MMHLSIVLAFVVTGASDPEDWPKVLREAQAKTRANLKEGRATMELTYTPPKSVGKDDVIVQAEIEWSGENIFQKHRFFCKYDNILDRKNEQPIETSPWDYLMRNATEVVAYNAAEKLVDIRPLKEDDMSSLLEFHPWNAWLKASPPNHKHGRPWSEMIDLQLKGAPKSEHEYIRQGDEIKHTRRGPAGHVVEIVYSLSHGGNVVSLSGKPAPAQLQFTRGSYNWRQQGPAFVLDSCECVTNFGRNVNDFKTYQLKVKSVSLEPVSPKLFTREHLLESIPEKRVRVREFPDERGVEKDLPPR
jgi:hypothetical protein